MATANGKTRAGNIKIKEVTEMLTARYPTRAGNTETKEVKTNIVTGVLALAMAIVVGSCLIPAIAIAEGWQWQWCWQWWSAIA